MGIQISDFGTTKSGTPTHIYTVKNNNNMTICLTDFGAILTKVLVPDNKGNIKDVVLGFDDLNGYESKGSFFGATVGRVANRIGGASFELNGVTYKLDKNDGENNLHSGFNGYNDRVWTSEIFEDSLGSGVAFSLLSEDMDQGFPGNLNITVTYTLTEDNSIIIEYSGVSDKDTIVNMTNHSFFNLEGHDAKDVLNQIVWIDSDEFTPADEQSIPHGKITKVIGTPMDFNQPKKIGKEIEADYEPLKFALGYDHNWILKTKRDEVLLVANLYDEISGRYMEVYTDLPGMQLYTGNFINNIKGKDRVVYKKRAGVCFETQYFPNAINVDNFEKPILKAEDEYYTTTIYKFGVKK